MGGGPSHPARSAGRCREGPCARPRRERGGGGARVRGCARAGRRSGCLSDSPRRLSARCPSLSGSPAGRARRSRQAPVAAILTCARPPSSSSAALASRPLSGRALPPLRTWRPSGPGWPGSLGARGGGGAGPRAEGCDWSSRPRRAGWPRGRRPQSAPCARGRPAAERAPSRMPAPWWQAPDAAGRAARPQVSARGRRGLGTAGGAEARPRGAHLEAGLSCERKAGGGDPRGVSLASPSYCCVAVGRRSAAQDRRADHAVGARATPGATRARESRVSADPGALGMKR